MSEIKLIHGGISADHRGAISHVNGLDMTDIRRFYVIHQADTSVVRAWHAHQNEQKWFYVIKGSFLAAFVKIDDWDSPSPDLRPETFKLSAQNSEVLFIPKGYANGFKALEPDSVLLVYSNKILEEAVTDSWRYDKDLWMKWE